MKFKEFRITLFLAFLALIALIVGVLDVVRHQAFTRLWMALGMCAIIGFLLLTRFNLCLYEDDLMAYRFMGIGLFPCLIAYQDIEKVVVLSKHRIRLDMRHPLTIYVFNSQSFYQQLTSRMTLSKSENHIDK